MVHPSPVFADLILSGRTNLVNRASIYNIDLRRANSLSKKKSIHLLLYPLRLEYTGKFSSVAIE